MKELFNHYRQKLLPEQNKDTVKANRRKNWLFLLSALAFFCLSMDNKIGYGIGVLIAMGGIFVAAGQIPSVWQTIIGDSRKVKLFYGLTAAGICLGGQSYFYRQTRKLLMPQLDAAFLVLSFVGAAAAFYFVYVCAAVFWRAMTKTVSGTSILKDITRGERIVMAVLFAALSALTVYGFSQSEAFSGTEHLHAMLETEFLYDILYTSDTAALQRENVFFALTHPQNDLRQPLFAVFAAPLLGIPYLAGRLVTDSQIVQMILLNLGQILMLLISNWIIAKAMGLSPVKRISFVIFSSCMYSNLLFSLMMEQYIVAYFWLALCVYQICEKGRPDRIALLGAGGTLLTSMVLLPAMSEKHPVKQFKDWFVDMVKYGLEFVALMLLFARFDVFTNLLSSVDGYVGFTKAELTLTDKLCQYTEFIKNCFAVPTAGVNLTMKPHASWQLESITALNWVGIGILALSIVSALWNWKNKSSRMAVLWVGFSVVMLLVLGWGTAENGLILYALYFGWAFLVLLFQLVEKLEKTLRIKYLTCICGILAAVALLAVNIPAIFEMIDFAITYYPA